MVLLLQPASPTMDHQDRSKETLMGGTIKGSEVLRSSTARRRKRVYLYEQATKATRVTRAGTCGKGNAPLKGCIGLLLILYSMPNTATDRRWARLHSKTPTAIKTALLTTLSSSLRSESTAS